MTELSIEKVHSPSFNINNSVVPTWTSQQMQQVTPPGGSLRAGQRRLRIENTAARLQNNISPEALDALIKYSNNKENWSALNYAICYAHDWKAAEALIEAGIGINTRDGHVGYTPIIQLLDLATHGHPPYRENGTALLRKLIQKGIDLSLPMGNGLNQGQYILGETALFYCAPHLNAELELFLTKYKIDLNFVTKSNTHPIQMAIQFPNLEAIKTLIKHGAKINNIDCFSRLYSTGTAPETKELISFLITNGANPLIPSNFDQKTTAVDQFLKRILALPNEHYGPFKKEMIPYLMGLGAKLD